MHIVMLSDLETQGGAAIAASRLAEALCRADHQVTRVVRRADGQEHVWQTRTLTPPIPFYQRLLNLAPSIVQTIIRATVREQSTQRRLAHLLADLHPNVINVHNLHKAAAFGWSVNLLQVCAQYAPTIWTLHDMWSFTGRCAYSYACRKFISGCDASCPTAMEYPALEPKLIARAWKMRHRLFAEQGDLAAACPSRWLAEEALAGFWAGHRVEVIPYGLPLDIYLPLERSLARATLGINSGGPVLLAVAQDITARRKGGTTLVEALQRVQNRPLTLITLGHGHLPVEAEGISLHPLGYIDHERTKVLAYNAADLLVHPALVDNLPNVVMEAIACGTPCAGFAIGGVPDMVRPGLTGWLAQDVTAQGLADVIDEALTAIEQGADLRSSCRAIAEAEYDVGIQAQRYLQLFKSFQRKSDMR